MNLDDRRIALLYDAWRHGSMRAAADVLDLAPSSISRQIARLEEETGASLIEHGRREIRLTEAGHAVIDYFRARRAGVDELEGRLQDLSSGRSGHVHLALGEGFLGLALYDTLDSFMDGFPGMTLSVSVTDTTQMVRQLLEDEVHFGLGFHSLSHPQIVSRYRAPVPLMAIMRADHPLARRESIGFDALCREPLALMGQSFRIRQMLDAAALDSGHSIAPGFTSNSIALLTRTAVAGRALTVLPAFSVSAEIAAGTLASVAIEAPQLQAVYVHLLARRNRVFPPHLGSLIEQIRTRLLPSALKA
ncbi:LysR family transcriptional regulator [Mameliella alba]|uniref:LysR family transcriptional regulator n=1 Tax=Mameliella alba TaxID=561184 RepID=UPI0013E41859|nr:LysR family transcriptional regulator [Mameliella alba]BBU55947.1 LysR family transcriptional regulator [Mameliella alba]